MVLDFKPFATICTVSKEWSAVHTSGSLCSQPLRLPRYYSCFVPPFYCYNSISQVPRIVASTFFFLLCVVQWGVHLFLLQFVLFYIFLYMFVMLLFFRLNVLLSFDLLHSPSAPIGVFCRMELDIIYDTEIYDNYRI